MKVLILAEHNNKKLKLVNYHTYTAATQLNAELDMLIIGFNCKMVVEEAEEFPSLRKIWIADAVEYENQLPENVAMLIAEIAENYDYVISGATAFGKNILPRVSALLDVAMIADVI